MALAWLLGFGSPLTESLGVVIHGSSDALVASGQQDFKRIGLKRVSSLKLLPSRVMSRAYGAVSHLTLPVVARPLVYGLWSWMFKVKLDEADMASLKDYQHLTEFFTRKLKPGARRVDNRPHILASPVDGAVVSLSCDLTGRGVLRQVKGIDYHVCDFLGVDSLPPTRPAVGGSSSGSSASPAAVSGSTPAALSGSTEGSEATPATGGQSPLVSVEVDPAIGPQGTALFSAVLYLAPGDYHQFHSPTEWTAEHRAHIAGQLLPVNPAVVQVLPSLFCANERVALMGSWSPARPSPVRTPSCVAGDQGGLLASPSSAAVSGYSSEGDGSEDLPAAANTCGPVPCGALSPTDSASLDGAVRPKDRLFFSYTAVGATNVGSIRLNCEPGLVTNTYKHDWACGFSPGDYAAAAGLQVPKAADLKHLPKAVSTSVAQLPQAVAQLQSTVQSTVQAVTAGVSGRNMSRNNSAVDLKTLSSPPRAHSAERSTGTGTARAGMDTPSTPSAPMHAPSPIVVPPRQRHRKQYESPVPFGRGDDVGVFELGSTIVLVFEAPVDFKWTVREGDKVRVGQALGHLPALKCTCSVCGSAPPEAFLPSGTGLAVPLEYGATPSSPGRTRLNALSSPGRGPTSSGASDSDARSSPESAGQYGSDDDGAAVVGQASPSTGGLHISVPGTGRAAVGAVMATTPSGSSSKASRKERDRTESCDSNWAAEAKSSWLMG